MMVTLSRLGEDEDGGLCTTCRLVKVTRNEMERFPEMKLQVELLGERQKTDETQTPKI